MKKPIDIVLKVVLSLILVLPILGLTRLMPPATQDLYNTPEAFAVHRQTINEGRYISIIMASCTWSRWFACGHDERGSRRC